MTAEAKPGEHPRIGVLSPLVAGSYTSNLIAGVTAATRASGTRVVAIQTLDLDFGANQEQLSASVPRGSPDGEYLGWPLGSEALVPHFTVRAAWEQVAGFLVVVNAVEPWYLQALRDAGKPVVMLSHAVEGFPCPVVRADNRNGILQAVSHLVEHGHRRIAFAGSHGPDRHHRAPRRVPGGPRRPRASRPGDDLVFEATDNLEGGGEVAARQMLAAGMPSTAVVAATDYNALGIMRALREAGLVLPRDQAIIGFDDVPAAASSQPTLSTVHQSFEEIGRVGATLLLEMIQGHEVPPDRHLVPDRPRAPRVPAAARPPRRIRDTEDPDRSPPGRRPNACCAASSGASVEGEAPTPEQTAALERAVDVIVSRLEPASGDPVPDGLAEAAADPLLGQSALDHDQRRRRLPAAVPAGPGQASEPRPERGPLPAGDHRDGDRALPLRHPGGEQRPGRPPRHHDPGPRAERVAPERHGRGPQGAELALSHDGASRMPRALVDRSRRQARRHGVSSTSPARTSGRGSAAPARAGPRGAVPARRRSSRTWSGGRASWPSSSRPRRRTSTSACSRW